jgi:hypothetical protein
VPQSDAGLVAYDLVSGAERWRSPRGEALWSTPQLMAWAGKPDAAVFFLSASGRGFVLAIPSGKVLWQDQVTNKDVEADPVIVDLNGDRVPEIVCADLSGALRVLDGAGSFGKQR